MSINENKKNSVTIPTISSVIKFICKVLDIKIEQNKEVIIANRVSNKIQKFNDETLKTIVDTLFIKIPKNPAKDDNIKQEILYKTVLSISIEITETIVSKIQNQFMFQSNSDSQFKIDCIKYFVSPMIAWLSRFNYFPASDFWNPIAYLYEISILICKEPNKKTDLIIRNYLYNEASTLIKQKKESYLIFNVIKNIKETSITSNKKIIEHSTKFLDDLNHFMHGKNHIDEINDFIDKFYGSMILLRLKRELKDKVIFDILIKSFVVILGKYETQDRFFRNFQNNHNKSKMDSSLLNDYITSNDIDEYIHCKNIFIKIIKFFSYFTELEKITREEELTKFIEATKEELEADKLSKLTLKNINYFREIFYYKSCNYIEKSLNNFECFKTTNNMEINDLLTFGIDYPDINNIAKLNEFIQTLIANQTYPFKNAIIYFINSILHIKVKNLELAITYSKLVIDESKKWHLGKIKSDSLLIYICCCLMIKNLKAEEIYKYVSDYHECKPPEIIFYENNKITEHAIVRKTVEVLIKKFHKLAIELKVDCYVEKLNSHLLPKNFGEMEPIHTIYNT